MSIRKAGMPVLVLWLLLLTSSGFGQEAPLADRVKAAFIFNFIQYSEWPGAARAGGSTFNLCLVGDTFKTLLDDTVRGEKVNGRLIAVRELADSGGASGCQLIYFRADANPQTASDILNIAKSLPILTVGETPEFLRNGGIVRFTRAGNQIHFEINPAAATKVSLSISSRLLRLAQIVRLQ